jgi:hypothetical protein
MVKTYLNQAYINFASNSYFYILFHFLDTLSFTILIEKICSNKYNKINILHLIVAPPLSSGW